MQVVLRRVARFGLVSVLLVMGLVVGSAAAGGGGGSDPHWTVKGQGEIAHDDALISFKLRGVQDTTGGESGRITVAFDHINQPALVGATFKSTNLYQVLVVERFWPGCEQDLGIVLEAEGKLQGQSGWRLRINAVDFGEPSVGWDSFRFRLWGPTGQSYDSWVGEGGDFPDEDPASDPCGDGTELWSVRAKLDQGSFTVIGH